MRKRNERLWTRSQMGRCSRLHELVQRAENGKQLIPCSPTAWGQVESWVLINWRCMGSTASEFPKIFPDGWCIKSWLGLFGCLWMSLNDQTSGSMARWTDWQRRRWPLFFIPEFRDGSQSDPAMSGYMAECWKGLGTSGRSPFLLKRLLELGWSTAFGCVIVESECEAI